jgi:hypothetical protein
LLLFEMSEALPRAPGEEGEEDEEVGDLLNNFSADELQLIFCRLLTGGKLDLSDLKSEAVHLIESKQASNETSETKPAVSNEKQRQEFFVGNSVRLQPLNSEGHYIAVNKDYFEAFIVKGGKDKSTEWKIVPGLSGRGVSFECSQTPGYFVRQQKGRLKVHSNDASEVFQKDASFEIRRPNCDVEEDNYVSFESISFPGFFIRCKNFELWIDHSSADKAFQIGSTFRVSFADKEQEEELKFAVEKVIKLSEDEKKAVDENELVDRLTIGKAYRFVSLNYPNHSISADTVDAFIFRYPGSHTNQWRVRNGLAGRGVSFESLAMPNRFLHCSNSRLKLLNKDGSRKGKEEATFIVRKALADSRAHSDCVSLESLSSPGCFIRQKNYELWVDPKLDGDHDFKEDACFKPVGIKGK